MERMTRKIAIVLLCGGILLAYTSVWNDAATVDEDPHIGAGISYLTQRDLRLNPEHPPLVKDLAALPLLFIPHLSVPTSHRSWTDDVNGQWDFGRAFLFTSGNNADTILHLARIAPILIMASLGYALFSWTARRYGPLAGLLALLAYLSNPVILAHGRLVTTDVPAAAGIFIATIAFLSYLEHPSRKTLFRAGIAFGIAQLLKFSAILLVPFFALLAVGYAILDIIVQNDDHRARFSKKMRLSIARILGGTIAIGIIGLALIYAVYAFHVWHYPPERQIRDTAAILESFPNQTIAEGIVALAKVPLLRPLAAYLLGLAMVVQRATGGNTTFFLGEVSAAGWTLYFPIVYLIKLPLAFHILTIIAAAVGIRALMRACSHLPNEREIGKRRYVSLAQWKKEHFPEFAMILFIAIYWFTSLRSNLNIGVRHLMPTIPFVTALMAGGIRAFLRIPRFSLAQPLRSNIISILRMALTMTFRNTIVALLVVWLIVSGLRAWPSYLASFNEIAALRGGGVAWAVDSNLDWGQDLKRLAAFVEKRGISRMTIDYFGWSPPEYYIRTAEVIPWQKERGRPSGWFAVSATFRQQGCARPAPGFTGDTTSYCFLNDYLPEAVIGGSIYVYHLP